ncbi:MAG: esterase/lipase family protein [Gammaproteobacteria bacterium]
MRYYRSLILLLVLIFSSVVHADTVLLLHGYLGSSYEWHRSGIVTQLDSAGWHNAGVLVIHGERVLTANKYEDRHTRRVYSLELASEQSIDKQAEQLDQYIEYVRYRHPQEQIILTGHSAGGVVARLYMVKNPSDDLSALVTIASPHLGTKNAEYAQTISENLLVWVDGVPGVEKLYRSQGLYFDLIPGRSDNLIAWLNYQEHPQARYYSIVRKESDDAIQDFVVPSWSQDMNEVYALRGRSTTYKLKSMHSLSAKDGALLNSILIDLYTI